MQLIIEGQRWDAFTDHITRNKKKYLAGAVGLVLGRHLIHKYATDPESTKNKAGIAFNRIKNFGNDVKDYAASYIKDTDTDIRNAVQNIKHS